MYKPNAYSNRLSARPGNDRSLAGNRVLDAFFDPKNHDFRSIREAYVFITGDKHVTGRVSDCDASRMIEAIGSTDWANALGDAITRRMLREYNLPEDRFQMWRDLAIVGQPIRDFRTQERTRVGGYGNLPAVAENGAYTALTSPADEKATYALSKRGGTETITLEAISNDDSNAVSRVPKKLSEAAKRTLLDFVLGFLKDNPVIYDTNPLFHAAHGNLGSASLSAAAVAAGRVAMRNQTELGSGQPLGAEPAVLWLPAELEEVGFNLFQRGTNNDRTFVERMDLKINTVLDWTDVNDWCLSASTSEVPCIEIGFFGGQEDPELFLQDDPINGSLFSNDRVIYKIRHIYGGTVTDFRGLYKSVVA